MIVFVLDFDGPLFPDKIHFFPQNQGEVARHMCEQLNLHPFNHYWFADPFAIGMLNDLYEKFHYKLVISSSWADDRMNTKEQIANLLRANHLVFDFHPDWRTPRDPSIARHKQVEAWLLAHPEIQHYLVLDDIISAPGFKTDRVYETGILIPDNVFLAHELDGFSYAQFQSMRRRLESWTKRPVSQI